MLKKKITKTQSKLQESPQEEKLFQEVSNFIEESRRRVVAGIHKEMVQLYWHIGKRIREDVLQEKRAEYGQEIIENLGKQLTAKYGRGFSSRNLFRMVRFAEVFPAWEILPTVGTISWSHLCILIYIEDDLKRDFYLEMCRIEKWSVRTLQKKIDGMLFERTAISRKPRKLIRQELDELREKQELSQDFVFKDPYVLDFLGLEDTYSEKDLENSILRKLEGFLLELGTDFTFVGRQKRITVDHEDYYIDLLFYHRGLCALIVIDLKLDKFKPAYKGQMELYLRYLEKYEKKPNENLPVGLILCSDKSEEVVELMHLDEDRIRVAEYWTQLPSKKMLEEKLHYVKDEAQREIEQRGDPSSRPGKNKENFGKFSPLQQEIWKICNNGWVSCREIAEQTSYKVERLRKQIKSMLEEEILEYRYPDNPRHPKQKYRVRKSDKEGKS